MAINRNTETAEEIRDVFKMQQNVDGIISNVAGQIIPVVDVNPKHARRCLVARRATATNATTATIYTTPSDKDFFLNSLSVGYIKDATSTSLYSGITATIDGVARELLLIPGITLTAANGSVSVSFPVPLKVDRGTSILCVNSTNVANVSCISCITGYTVEGIRA